MIGEDGNPYYEAEDVLVENNLMLGNSGNVMRSAFGVKGGRNITFRNNTVVGDLPSLAFAMRINTEGENPPNDLIYFYNNIWSDPSGTMGSDNQTRPNDFSDTPPAETNYYELAHNLYWNGQNSIPSDNSDLINYDDDTERVVGDPLLGDQSDLTAPHLMGETFSFSDGSTTIREAFIQIVSRYGVIDKSSPAIDAGDPGQAPEDDILGQARTGAVDIGAFERKD